MNLDKEIFYLGIDFLDINAHAIYLDLIGEDYRKLLFSFWSFPIDIYKTGENDTLADIFSFNEQVLEDGLAEFYSLKRCKTDFCIHEELLREMGREIKAGRPVLWATDSKILPYHWTYENDETNHGHMVLVIGQDEGMPIFVDPGWIDATHYLSKRDFSNSVRNRIITLCYEKNDQDCQKDFYRTVKYMAVKASERDKNNMDLFDRIQYFSQLMLTDFNPDKERISLDNNRSRIWMNPLIRNINEISKYRFHISESFKFIWEKEHPNHAGNLSEKFLQSSKQWNTLKFMCSHILLQEKKMEGNNKKLSDYIQKICDLERDILSDINLLLSNR